ncbi:YqjK-like family protein [Pseudothauera lacus]|uniref:YqjK-like protein n=1 Tax=Pseudothauera lacus TaxID=2136175 RepID=A0A2T4IIL7_9RHOO|nr:YqjK-like family protein [Pseudothauera lacus]PTD97610.1 hypothetical protein C8261_02730 [Pseudothauera lacus]
MNARVIELALRKQRLQIQAEGQRADMLRRLEGFESALDVADGVRENLRWASQHTPALSAGAVLFVLWKPRLVLRLAKRAWLGWMLYRKVGRAAAPALAAAAGLLSRWRAARAG